MPNVNVNFPWPFDVEVLIHSGIVLSKLVQYKSNRTLVVCINVVMLEDIRVVVHAEQLANEFFLALLFGHGSSQCGKAIE